MSQRTERIDELLRQEIGEILTREVADPRVGFATVTEVETAPDLRHARVWISVIGQRGERDETIGALQHAMPFVRRELGTRLRLKRIPELHVRLDDSAERGTRVMKLIDELEAGDLPDSEGPGGESLPTPVPRLRREGDAPEPAIEPPTGVDVGANADANADADRGLGEGRRRPATPARRRGQVPAPSARRRRPPARR
jgi:ribosome-binding factor A